MKKFTSSIFCVGILILVFLFFYQTLFYKVKLFDEVTIFKETYLPVCFSISEIFELISLFGLNQHFEATNTLYSNISSIRSDPLGNLIQLFVQFFCRKSPFSYHLYSLVLHLINTAFVFLILNKLSWCLHEKKTNTRLLLVSLLTIFWSLHPVNVEPVLLITNANVLLSYSFCFLVIFLYLNSFQDGFQKTNISFLSSTILFFVFLIALFMAEYHFLLPIILIFHYLSVSASLSSSIKVTFPLLLACGIFIFNFLISPTRANVFLQNSPNLILERIFWLSPQIIFHYLKLFLLPINLSIDQTFLVKIGKSLSDPYSIFCFITISTLVLIPLVFLIKTKLQSTTRFPYFLLTLFLFLISLIPFSHILVPIYNLASERYLYFPSFIFVFGLSHFLFSKITSGEKVQITSFVLLALITFIYTSRAYIRTLDWKNSETLYLSSIKTLTNPLHKAFRYKGLTPQKKIFVKYPEKEVDKNNSKLAISHLKEAISNLNNQKKTYQTNTPNIVKSYGLDPASLLAKAGYYLAQTDFTLNEDPKRALKIIKPFVKDLSLLDSAGLSFYASVLYHNGFLDETEKVLRFAHKRNPFAIRIIYPLCDLIQMKYGNLNEIENLTLKTHEYFPYDTFTLLVLTKIYKLKGDLGKYAHFSYAYGLRHHSIEDLNNAKSIYLTLNNTDKVKKIEVRIIDLEKKLNKNLVVRQEIGDRR